MSHGPGSLSDPQAESSPTLLSARQQTLKKEISSAAELLPLQGPITAFAFLNPLQGLEHLSYDDALRTVHRTYGCAPYLPESWYREKLKKGRITADDLRAVLREDLGERAFELVAGLARRKDMRLQMLLYPLHSGDTQELGWVIAESDALQKLRPEIPIEMREKLLDETRDWTLRALKRSPGPTGSTTDLPAEECKIFSDTVTQFNLRTVESWPESTWESMCLNLLWKYAERAVGNLPEREIPGAIRHADVFRQNQFVDPDFAVTELLTMFCSAYLDQGFSHWRLPRRDDGFLEAFLHMFSSGPFFGRRTFRRLPEEIADIRSRKLHPLEIISENLELLGVTEQESAEFIQATLLALRGWAGMLWQTEVRADRVYIGSPEGTLIEYVAVRLLLDRLSIEEVCHELSIPSIRLEDVRAFCPPDVAEIRESDREQQAFVIFQLAQLLGWSPRTLASLTDQQWNMVNSELVEFSGHERRRTFHTAFERHFSTRALDAIHSRALLPHVRPEKPQLQIVCCIDAREESFRRHLEELAPDVETFGTAGFFGIPMYFRGAADAHFTALCPIVIRPQHWVVEDVVFSMEDIHKTRTRARRVLGTATHSLHVGTRSSVTGAILSTLVGPLATVPLLSRILFPRIAGRMNQTAQQFVAPPKITRLRLERLEKDAPGQQDDGIGFTLSEMCNMAERALRDIGLTERFAPMVIILGHGSTCLNNPHESAYHCGACSGSAGGPNARALAAMLNDPRVRRVLRERGLVIPEETYFIGGLHNTATEEITFFDLELLPTFHVRSLRLARELFSRVAERNAHERCRRFESARLDITPPDALLHVQNRAEDLAQTRPEYGNSTNAMCFVGRRSRVRGLYLDRRSFLMSYDAGKDTPEAAILARILGAVIPVCEGINMLYTLSAIDTPGWGSGTKLPHNVTSLLGVMDGAASDLRPGLPLQGIDIHEPMRLLFVIESRPAALLKIMNDNPTVGRIIRNGWAQLALLDPDSSTILRFRDGEFVPYTPSDSELPMSESSIDWYRGRRDHLPFAGISKTLLINQGQESC